MAPRIETEIRAKTGSKSSPSRRVVLYRPLNHFPVLKQLAEQQPHLASLGYRSFVDWYYGSSKERCRLLVAMQGEELAGIVGAEAIEFETHTRERFTVGFGQNFYSFVPGVGARLFFLGSRAYGGGVAFGGVPATHRILEKRRWVIFNDVYEWSLNPPGKAEENEPKWKETARSVRARLLRTDLRELGSRGAASGIAACQAQRLLEYSQDLSPDKTDYSWRFRPSLEHLKWRYPLRDGLLRYRVYQAERAGQKLGFVVLSWRPDQVIVAHVDVARRSDYLPVVVSTLAAFAEENPDASHASVQLTVQQGPEEAALSKAGFRRASRSRFFAVGQQGEGDPVEIPLSGGNFSLGIGDNDLREPFWEDAADWPGDVGSRRVRDDLDSVVA